MIFGFGILFDIYSNKQINSDKMKTAAIILALTIFHTMANGQAKNFIDQPYLETIAKADTLVIPDKIFLNILITEKDTKGKVSVEELESKMEATLKSLGIDTKEKLALNDLASNFKKYFLRSQDVLKTKSYTLEVNNAILAGQVIASLEKIDVSNVRFERTEFSRMKSLKLELKSKAISEAKRQAMYLTQPLNQKVGPAIHISDMTDIHAYNRFQGRAEGIQVRGYAAKADIAPADIEFQKIKVESQVNVKFKLME